MNQTVIRVENLSKRYRIGGTKAAYHTLRESLIEGVRNPVRRFSSIIGGDASRYPKNEGTIWALKEVSFEVKEGETLGIIGRNGAGKSTLLKILSRITKPTSGQVTLRGRVGSLLEVGTGFHPELTGRENIYLNGAILGMHRNEISRKFDEIVDFSEIEKFLDTPVKHYSSGMYMRLAFAVAAHLEPEILLVDEVLAVGDVAFQKKCLGKMGQVANQGRTVLFVSHNMPAVILLCEGAIHIETGKLLHSGKASNVVATYLKYMQDYQAITAIAETNLRSGTGEVRFKDIRFYDENNGVTTTFYSGSLVKVVFEFDLRGQLSLSDIIVGFTVRDQEDRPIFICRTDFQAQVIDSINAGKPLVCIIPRLPLYPGDYFITAAINKNNVVADLLERVAQITVQPADFFGSGRLATSTKAQALVTHEWREL